MLKLTCGLLLALGVLVSFRADASAWASHSGRNPAPNSPLRYANPLMGTGPLTDPKDIGYAAPKSWRGAWAGLVFPGSSLPNALVQLSPITEFGTGAGYDYADSVIYGFAHTNKGHWNLCHLPVLPVSGAVPEAEFMRGRLADGKWVQPSK